MIPVFDLSDEPIDSLISEKEHSCLRKLPTGLIDKDTRRTLIVSTTALNVLIIEIFTILSLFIVLNT